ncbi:uncharacterized protein DSM5745_03952 [Aspergillus mulundensis]|uniref:Uncharacterized protein n=1 Tax=Aspergillus mulundensis TaxID=1810919 RepID=A0A3D8SBD4_9EURO|nr:hypothetical protein DSM5745_03952 [Aspergillus mulundensis]RDW83626.1 hypothetical protein DSM5745_03952 [Aspergillus mulundensis]
MPASLFSKLHSMVTSNVPSSGCSTKTLTQTVAAIPGKLFSTLRSIIPIPIPSYHTPQPRYEIKGPLCATIPGDHDVAVTIEQGIRIKSLMKGAEAMYDHNKEKIPFDVDSITKDFHRFEEWGFMVGLHEAANTTTDHEYNTSYRLSRRGKNLQRALETGEERYFIHHLQRLEDRVIRMVTELVSLESGVPFEKLKTHMEFSIREVSIAIDKVVTWRFGDDDDDKDDEDEEFFDVASVATELEEEVLVTEMDAFEQWVPV